MEILKHQMQKIDENVATREDEAKKRQDFIQDFLRNEVSEDEMEVIRRLVRIAADKGEMEALVHSFPSDLCSDSGRAINNGSADWPETLTGKAKKLYDRYRENAAPSGFQTKGRNHQLPGRRPG